MSEVICEDLRKLVVRARCFKTKICPWHGKGRCNRGNSCNFAHSENEKREPDTADFPNLHTKLESVTTENPAENQNGKSLATGTASYSTPVTPFVSPRKTERVTSSESAAWCNGWYVDTVELGRRFQEIASAPIPEAKVKCGNWPSTCLLAGSMDIASSESSPSLVGPMPTLGNGMAHGCLQQGYGIDSFSNNIPTGFQLPVSTSSLEVLPSARLSIELFLLEALLTRRTASLMPDEALQQLLSQAYAANQSPAYQAEPFREMARPFRLIEDAEFSGYLNDFSTSMDFSP